MKHMEGNIIVIGSQFGWIKGNNGHNYMFDAKEYQYLLNNKDYVKFDIVKHEAIKDGKKKDAYMAMNVKRVRYIGM